MLVAPVRHDRVRMSRISTWTLRVLLGVFLCEAFATGQAVSALKPVWTTDLRQAGFPPPQGFRFSLSRYTLHADMMSLSLAFGRGGHIVVACVTQEIGGKTTLASIQTTRELHVVSLDALTGKVIATGTWPAPWAHWDSARIGATREGNFVTMQEHTLYLYSPDLKEINRAELPANTYSGWSLTVPPDGRAIFLSSSDPIGRYDSRILDARTLREIRSWKGPEVWGFPSSTYFARLGKNRELCVRGLDTEWRPIATLNACPDDGWRPYVSFIRRDALLVSLCHSVQIIRVDGQVLFAARVPWDRLAGRAWSPPDGQFVAVATSTLHGLGVALAFDMSAGQVPRGIRVYDTKSGRLVGTLKDGWQYAGAFSPDDDSFALLNGGVIKLFRFR